MKLNGYSYGKEKLNGSWVMRELEKSLRQRCSEASQFRSMSASDYQTLNPIDDAQNRARHTDSKFEL